MKNPKITTKTVFKIRLKKDDVVMVRAGKYKGKTGKVVATHPNLNKVTVEGINIVKKHMKPNKQYPQGGIIDITKPIDVSKVGVVDPSTKKAARVAYKLDKDGKKTRVFAGTERRLP